MLREAAEGESELRDAGRSGGSPEHDGLICKGSSEIRPTQLKRKNKNNPSTKQSNQLEVNYCSQF